VWKVKVQKTKGFAHLLDEDVERTTKYDVASVLSQRLAEEDIDRDRYLQLPAGYSPRIRRLAEELSQEKTEEGMIDELYRFLKYGQFYYTMTDLPVSDHPLEDFFFVHQKGNCEYFASSLAVMLRMVGIPSRLVGGYQGGYYNNTGKYYMVLQKNAHVWVEAYLDGYGWKRLDPTTSQTLDPPSSLYESEVFLRLKLLLDTLNYYWNRVIINYDFSRQVAIARKIQSTLRRPHLRMRDLKPKIETYAIPVVSVALAAYLIGLFIFRRKGKTDKLIAKFNGRMKIYGYEKRSNEGLEEFLSRVKKEDVRNRAHDFIIDFQSLYYKDVELTKEDIRRLEHRIEKI
jgi:hypothetical protein